MAENVAIETENRNHDGDDPTYIAEPRVGGRPDMLTLEAGAEAFVGERARILE